MHKLVLNVGEDQISIALPGSALGSDRTQGRNETSRGTGGGGQTQVNSTTSTRVRHLWRTRSPTVSALTQNPAVQDIISSCSSEAG